MDELIQKLKLLLVALMLLGAYAIPAAFGQGSENPFGSATEDASSLKGEIYYLPEDTSALPDFSTLTPVGTIYTKVLDIPQRSFTSGFPGVTNRFEWFAIRYTGSFFVENEGKYTFRLVSDDGSHLFIDGNKIIDNDGIHAPSSVTGEADLTRGQHQIEVDYFQGPRELIALQLFWTPPGGTEVISEPQYVPRPPAMPSLLDHAMASEVQEFSPYDVIRRTNTFKPTDSKAYSWLSFGEVYGAHSLEWRWYSPDGSLDSTGSHEIPISSEDFWESYNAYYYIDIAGYDPAQMPGQWHVDVYLDDQKILTEQFTIESTGGISGPGSAAVPCSSSNPPDLTGVWNCDDGGTYYIKQIRDIVWWLGEPSSTNPAWSNVAYGDIAECTAYLDYADIPKGSAAGSGSLVLEIVSNNEMKAIEKPESYGGSRWWRAGGTSVSLPASGPIGPTTTANPWEDQNVRQLIDEWLLQQDRCVKKIYPGAYIDRWGRLCGSTGSTTISCTQTPDKPTDWDNYHYLWYNNWCPEYYSYRVQDYVELRQSGESFDSLAECKARGESCY